MENGNQKSADNTSKAITEPNATDTLQTTTENKLTDDSTIVVAELRAIDDSKIIPEEPLIETESSPMATKLSVPDEAKTDPEPSAANEPEIKTEPSVIDDSKITPEPSVEPREADNMQIKSEPSTNDKETEIKAESHHSISSDSKAVSEGPEPSVDDKLQTTTEQKTIDDSKTVSEPSVVMPDKEPENKTEPSPEEQLFLNS